MHLNIGHHSSQHEERQQETREARRLLRESVKSDFEFPQLPIRTVPPPSTFSTPTSASSRDTIAGFRIADAADSTSLPEVLEWRERQYGSSDSDTQDDEESYNVSHHDQRGSRIPPAKSRQNVSSTEYLFEGPDSVGAEIQDRAAKRKQRRQRRLLDEMEWNTGLHHWIARREAWTGARPAAQVQLMEKSKSASNAGSDARNGYRGPSEGTNGSSTSSPRSSTSVVSETTLPSRPSTATTTPDPTTASQRTLLPPATFGDMLIPNMARILPNHPIRKKIGPNMYMEIYSKIITNSRTPTVPINLQSVTRALVHGWKADGEWPPRPGVPEPSVGRKRTTGIKEGVKAVTTRVLKITHAGDSTMPALVKDKKG